MTKSPKSICIVRLSAMGDVIMLVPLVRALQAHYKDTLLTWVISRPAYDLVEGMEGIEFIVIDKPESPLDYWRFQQRMKQRRFDILIAAQASFRVNFLYTCLRAKLKIGYDSIRAKDCHWLFVHERIAPGDDHTVDGFLKFARVLGVPYHEIRFDLPRNKAADDWALEHIPYAAEPLMLVNPAASKPERAWLVDRYIAVIKHMQQRWHARVVLVGGPAAHDRLLGQEIEAATGAQNLIGQTKPQQFLSVLRLADVLLCPDTGPSHMASAVGTAVVALHAVTSSRVSGPYLHRHLSVDYYPQAVTQVLNKTPLTNVWGTHAHGMDTMKLIPVEAVIRQLDLVFSEL